MVLYLTHKEIQDGNRSLTMLNLILNHQSILLTHQDKVYNASKNTDGPKKLNVHCI